MPRVDPQAARQTFAAVHEALRAGLVRSCHDLSEGGLAVAAAEMAFAGGLGMDLEVGRAPHELPDDGPLRAAALLFAESNTRFLCEVAPDKCSDFERALTGVPHACLGQVTAEPRLRMQLAGQILVDAAVADLKEAWQRPLRW